MTNKFLLSIGIFLSFSSLFAQEFCIIASSAPKLDLKEKEKFLKQYPSGVVEKQKKYYVFKLASYKKYKEIQKELLHVQKSYKHAFIINCQREFSPKVETEDIQVLARPLLNEPKTAPIYQSQESEKFFPSKSYDPLEFTTYLSALFEYNDNAEELFYQKKIDYLLNEIQKDRYNFDIYVDGYARTGQYISTQQLNIPNVQTGAFKESGVGVALNANKLLYDGQYSLINHTYDILNKRLADITALNAKEKLAILGLSIYSNLYTSQEKLRIYEEIYEKQKSMTLIISKGYNEGKNSSLDNIDAQNGLFSLERVLLNQKYIHVHNENILKHSIKSKGEKPYKLFQEKINFHLASLVDLQKQAIQNSSDIALESNKLKINQTDFIAQTRRYYPTVNFQSHLGYGTANDALYFENLNTSGMSTYWEAGLTFQIPIYNRKDIILNKDKELNAILKQKSVLSAKSREVLLAIEYSYNSIQRFQEQKEILEKQVALASKKIIIAKEEYFIGTAQYRDYSNALTSYLNYTLQLLDLEESYTKEMFILGILTGKKELYE